jgi:pimeloyl-ACP methyl ester carboxylesterase
MDVSRPKSFVKSCPSAPRRHDLGRVMMNAVAAGEGRPIIFLHGLGWDHTLWGGAMTRLADRYRVIAADTRGHGETDKPEGPYSVADFAEDWAALIRSLASEPALVVGFSLGGMIAQLLALDHPELVGALVLVNTSCMSPPVGSAHLAERLSAMESGGPASAARLAGRSVFSRGWRQAHPAEFEDFVAWRVGQDQQALRYAMGAAASFDASARVGRIAVPTLVVTALDDELMRPDDQAVLIRLILAAESVEIADSGHMLPIEQPEAFESALENFLARHWPPMRDDENARAGTRIASARDTKGSRP